MAPQGTDDRIAVEVKKHMDWSKWISIIITILVLSVGTVVWATTQHDELKEITDNKVRTVKEEIDKTNQRQYVPRAEFTPVLQSLKHQKEIQQEIKTDIKEILKRMDRRPRGSVVTSQ